MSSAEAERLRPRVGVILLAGLALLFLVALVGANLWTDYLWFRSVDLATVFSTRMASKVGLFLVFGLLMTLLILGNLLLAYRLRPPVRHANLDSEFLVQLRDVLDRHSRTLMLGLALVLGLMGGLAAADETDRFLGWIRATPFGTKDATFGLDASFYVFQLPWWRFVLGYVTVGLWLAIVATAIVGFLTGSLTVAGLRGRGNTSAGASRGAQAQLSVLLGLVLLLHAVSRVFERFELATTDNYLFTGVSYTDDTVRAPALLVMAGIAVLCALLCFVNAWRPRWRIPVTAFVLLLVTSIVLVGLYPWFVQKFQVTPNGPDKERDYISAQLTATRQAFGIDHVEVEDYEANTTASAGQLKADAEALPAIRLIDPAVVNRTFEQLQQVRQYYTFPSHLDVDRYDVGGKETDAVVAARELELSAVSEGNDWNNLHTVYTHGYGMVAAYGNQRQGNGEPMFFSGGIPTVGELPEHEPRIYFGEQSSTWVVVGAPQGTDPVELDTPGGGEGRSETKYTYAGSGGVPLSNPLTRLAYAVREGDINLLLSERVHSESKLLDTRVPVQRVRKVAPWLTLDADPYPSVVDGRVTWIIDGYTTSANYPNSNRVDWNALVSDSGAATLGAQVNYVRNSVKATVDAYDGTVTLYAWDEADPILQTWSKVYPNTITPKAEISDELMQHLRYPEDLFRVQREVMGRYHTSNATTWYQRSDVWEVPQDPVADAKSQVKEQPYFLTIRWPRDTESVYSNTTVFVPQGRQNLSVYMAVNSDATSPDYGRMRALKLSDAKQIAGPGQTSNAIQTDEAVAATLLPFNRQGATASATYGNLLTLPVGGGLMYVQPIYTTTNNQDGAYPALRFVVVRFGEKVGIGSTLQAALDKVFGGDAGATTGEEAPADPGVGTDPGTDVAGPEQAQTLLRQAMDEFKAADAALKAGDLATYQTKMKAAEALVERANKALDN